MAKNVWEFQKNLRLESNNVQGEAPWDNGIGTVCVRSCCVIVFAERKKKTEHQSEQEQAKQNG